MAAQTVTDTDLWPAYSTKTELLSDMYHAKTEEDWRQIYLRIGNTNMTSITSPTLTVPAFETTLA